MTKCYLIANGMQPTRCAQSLCFVPQLRAVLIQGGIYVNFVGLLSVASVRGQATAHDEFNGNGKVSAINRIVMLTTMAPLRLGAALCALLIGATGACAGDDASGWDGDARSAIRLIVGSRASANAPFRAAIEMRLASGWHTYWRYPGDAGVPPRFDFKASQNVKSVDVLFPVPRRLVEAGAVTIGYDGGVTLPLAIVAQDAGKPVLLRLKTDYAVCEKLCVPAEGKAQLTLTVGTSSLEPALAAAEARVPKKRALGEDGTLSIRSVKREDASPQPRVLVDVAAPPATTVDLFAEGPTAEWALPLPMPIPGAPAGMQRFAFELDGAPPGAAFAGVAITLTAIAGDEAIEVTTRLD
jgi:DsbC/DsbD-like thiol-disulfide interchange protein